MGPEKRCFRKRTTLEEEESTISGGPRPESPSQGRTPIERAASGNELIKEGAFLTPGQKNRGTGGRTRCCAAKTA